MSQEKIVAIPNIISPNSPVVFNLDICNGCNHCVEVCQIDVYIPHPRKGKRPIVLHPEECWYCGCCVNDCPGPGAIAFKWPLQQRGYWKNKATGEVHQIQSPRIRTYRQWNTPLSPSVSFLTEL
jgi:NAD-dependent dihydropyrimidine dehydrogenase PreA subunit